MSTDDAATAPSPATNLPVTSPSVLDRPLALTSEVSLRPERFGALLYHFGTRRLSFVKDERLATVLRQLPDASCARDACTAAGVDASELPTYERALAQLVRTDMLRERGA